MRIYLADHHILFREGLAGLLSAEPDMEVVGNSGVSLEAVEQVRALQPDLVLIDLRLPDGGALAALRAISATCPGAQAVVLTSQQPEDLVAVVESGAKGFLRKDIPISHLIDALRAVQRGEVALSREMTRSLIDQLAQRSLKDYQASGVDSLTDREAAVLRHVCAGASNVEIASGLGISENTVKAHVRKILEKLNVPNRRAARRVALEHGFLERRA